MFIAFSYGDFSIGQPPTKTKDFPFRISCCWLLRRVFFLKPGYPVELCWTLRRFLLKKQKNGAPTHSVKAVGPKPFRRRPKGPDFSAQRSSQPRPSLANRPSDSKHGPSRFSLADGFIETTGFNCPRVSIKNEKVRRIPKILRPSFSTSLGVMELPPNKDRFADRGPLEAEPWLISLHGTSGRPDAPFLSFHLAKTRGKKKRICPVVIDSL